MADVTVLSHFHAEDLTDLAQEVVQEALARISINGFALLPQFRGDHAQSSGRLFLTFAISLSTLVFTQAIEQ